MCLVNAFFRTCSAPTTCYCIHGVPGVRSMSNRNRPAQQVMGKAKNLKPSPQAIVSHKPQVLQWPNKMPLRTFALAASLRRLFAAADSLRSATTSTAPVAGLTVRTKSSERRDEVDSTMRDMTSCDRSSRFFSMKSSASYRTYAMIGSGRVGARAHVVSEGARSG